jgi:hypothetical protein
VGPNEKIKRGQIELTEPNIYQIAKNCRTSVGMIEKYYGVHVKNSLNAAAINVVRSGKDEMAEEFEYLMEEE